MNIQCLISVFDYIIYVGSRELSRRTVNCTRRRNFMKFLSLLACHSFWFCVSAFCVCNLDISLLYTEFAISSRRQGACHFARPFFPRPLQDSGILNKKMKYQNKNKYRGLFPSGQAMTKPVSSFHHTASKQSHILWYQHMSTIEEDMHCEHHPRHTNTHSLADNPIPKSRSSIY